MIKLYEDQERGVNLLRQSIAKGLKSIAFSAPCGYGKTVIMSDMVSNAVKKKKRVWIIVDSTELVEQTRETLKRFNIYSNVIQGWHEDTDYSGQVQVVMSQTITRRWQYFDRNPHWLPDLILIDECHTKYKAHLEIKNMVERHNKLHPNQKTIIGFSATPITKGLAEIYDDLVVGSTVRELIDRNRLTPIEAYACYYPDLKGVKQDAKGDYIKEDLAKRVNRSIIRGDVLKNWQKLGQNRKTIIYAVNVKHAEDLAETFTKAGVNCAVIKGSMNKEERSEFIENFRNNDIKVLVSVMTLVKGFDVPDVGCIILARPTKSLSLFIQQIGRGMRKNPIYDDCIVLDHGGNISRHGFPDEFLPSELDDGTKGNSSDRRKKDDPLPKPCPKCNYLKNINQHDCPKCGFKPERQANVNTETAYLEKITKSKLTEPQKRALSHSIDFKSKMFNSFNMIAKSEFHCNKLYEDYYSEKPKNIDKSQKVTDETILIAKKFLRYKAIRYANRKYR